jgi:hypothetical protein
VDIFGHFWTFLDIFGLRMDFFRTYVGLMWDFYGPSFDLDFGLFWPFWDLYMGPGHRNYVGLFWTSKFYGT